MKTLTTTLLIILAIQSSALASNSGQANLNAQQPVQLLQLVDQKFEPIYGQEPYQATCSQEVFDHTATSCTTEMDSVCHGGGEVCETQNDSVCNSQGCTSVPRRVCHQTAQTCTSVPRNVCHDYAVYRTVYYSCTKYRTVVVGQRLVKTFNHQIEVTINNAASLDADSLSVGVNISEDSISARLMSSFKRAVLNYKIEKVSDVDAGDVQNIRDRITIDLGMSAEKVKMIETASLTGLELGQSALRFDLNNASEIMQNLKIAIKLVRNPKFWVSTTLYNGSLKSSELGLVAQGNAIKALIPFQKMGVDSIGATRHDLSVSVSLDPGAILNAADFRFDLDKKLQQSLSKVNPTF
jgi:hypothetical protein